MKTLKISALKSETLRLILLDPAVSKQFNISLLCPVSSPDSSQALKALVNFRAQLRDFRRALNNIREDFQLTGHPYGDSDPKPPTERRLVQALELPGLPEYLRPLIEKSLAEDFEEMPVKDNA